MRKGFSLIEIVVAIAIFLVSFVAVVGMFQLGLRRGADVSARVQATALAEEGVEAMQSIRDAGWGNIAALTLGTEYGLIFDGSRWNTTAAPQIIDGIFERTVEVDAVYRRDSDKDIVAADSPDAKSIDAGTRKITVRVAWATTTPHGGEEVLERYLMNVFE